MKRTISAAMLVALVAAHAEADGAERNVWKEELTSSWVIFTAMDEAMRAAPDAGPERVIYTWTMTCIVDAKTNTKVTDTEEAQRAACEKWAQSPAARMQKRTEPTPYTAGQNAQVIWSMYPIAAKTAESEKRATAEQKQMLASCLIDTLAAFGLDDGLNKDRGKACFRMVGLTPEPNGGNKPSKSPRK